MAMRRSHPNKFSWSADKMLTRDVAQKKINNFFRNRIHLNHLASTVMLMNSSNNNNSSSGCRSGGNNTTPQETSDCVKLPTVQMLMNLQKKDNNTDHNLWQSQKTLINYSFFGRKFSKIFRTFFSLSRCFYEAHSSIRCCAVKSALCKFACEYVYARVKEAKL